MKHRMLRFCFSLFCLIGIGFSSDLFAASISGSASGTIVTIYYSTTDSNAYVSEWQNVSGTNYAWVSIGGTNPTGTIVITRAPGTYQYHVTGCGSGGCAVRATTSVTVSAPMPPTAPTNLLGSIGNGAISLSWAAPAGATSYAIYRGGSLLTATTISATNYNDSASLSPGTTYTYGVKACNAVGCSNQSTINIVYPPIPSVPTSFSASASGPNVNLSWGNVGANSYKLTRGTSNWTVSGAIFSLSDSTASAGSTYTYTIQACNAANVCSSTASTSISLPAVPQPTISASLVGVGINVTWTTGGANTFTVQRNGGATIASSGTSLRDTNIASALSYSYTIVACNVNNLCASSNSGAITIPSTPTVSVAVTGKNNLSVYIYGANVTTWQLQESRTGGGGAGMVTGGSGGTGVAQWDGMRPGGTYTYQIYYGVQSGTGMVYNYSASQTVTLEGTPPPSPPDPHASLSGSTITVTWGETGYSYDFYRATGSDGMVPTTAGRLSYSETAVDGTTYRYGVRACNLTGECSVVSNTSITKVGSPSNTSATINPRTLVAYVSTSAAPGANQYNFQQQLVGSGNWSTICSGVASACAPTISAAGTYIFQIQACNTITANCTGWVQTNSISASAPGAPSLSLPASSSSNSYTLSWPDVPNAASYTVTEFTNGIQTNNFSQSGTSYKPSGKANATYTYQVYATNPIGSSSVSSATINVGSLGTLGAVSATMNGATGVANLSWAPVSGATRYDVQPLLNGANSGGVQSFSNNTVTLPVVSTPGTYSYRVSACVVVGAYTNCGTPVVSNAVSLSVPATPALTLPTTSSTSSYTLSWSSVSNASNYVYNEAVNAGAGADSSPVTATSQPFSGKTNASYSYKVKACNVAGCSAYSAVSKIDVAMLGSLGAVAATMSGSTGVASLTWTGVTGATRYDVQPVFNGVNSGPVQSFTTNSPTLPAVSAAGTYTYKVTACAVVGSYTNCGTSVTSNSVSLSLPSTPTVTLPASSSTNYYTLSWSSVTNASSYIYNEAVNAGAGVDSSPVSATSQPFNGKPNASYSYKVKACNVVGCSAYSAVSKIDVAVMGSLGTVTASMNGATGAASLSWAPVSGATQYDIQAKLNGVNTGSVVVAYGTTTSMPAVSAAGTYTYQVTPKSIVGAYTNIGTAVLSNAVTLAAPSVITYVTPTPTASTDGSYSFKWNAASNAINYVVNENGSDLTPPVTSPLMFSVSGRPNAAYVYKIKACNVVGCSAYSPAINIDVVQVGPVSGVNASLLQSTGVTTLTWAPSILATYYSIQTKRNNAIYGSPVTSTSPTYIFPAVTEAGTYTYEVKACVTVGATTNCAAPVASNSVWPIQPDTPLLTTALFSSTGEYPVTWSTSLWATHYQLYENGTLIQDTGDWSKIFKGMTRKTNGTYFYTVKACWIVCSADSAQGVTIVSIPSASSGNTSAGTGTVFNFQTDAPSNFTYSLTSAGVPDLGANQFVAATQGNMGVSNGSAQYSVKLDLPPAIRDLKPSLSLSYNSRNGNGLMGMGWGLSGLSSITRCRTSFAIEGAEAQKSNPRYTNGDRLCLDGQKLVVASSTTPAKDATYWATGSEYKTEIDDFSRIVAYSSDNGAHAYFKVFTKSGLTLTYGGESDGQNSRIRKPGDANSVVGSWLLDKVEDAYGNSYTISYLRDTTNGNSYPDRINWGPSSAIKFEYRDRTGQVPSGYDMGGRYNFPKVLEKITTYIDILAPSDPTTGTPVKQYQIKYKLSSTTQRELVDTIAECGNNAGTWQCARPLQFSWQAGEQGFSDTEMAPTYCSGGAVTGIRALRDFDFDGYADALTDTSIAWGTSSGCFVGDWVTSNINSVDTSFSVKDVQPIMTQLGYAFLVTSKDMYGAGKVVLVYQSAGTKSTKLIASISKETVAGWNAGSPSPSPVGVVVGDLNNDGLDDFTFGGYVYYQNNLGTPDFTLAYTNLSSFNKFGKGSYVDLNGDGIKDWLSVVPTTGGAVPTQVQVSNFYDPDFLFAVNQPTDFVMPQSDHPPIVTTGGMFVVRGDLNGDADEDYIYFSRDADTNSPTNGEYVWKYRLNLQSKTGPEVNTHVIAVKTTDPNPSNRYAWAYDWDKDGRDDLLAVLPGTCTVRVLLSRGSDTNISFQELKDANGNTFITPLPDNVCAPLYDANIASRLVGDINNDGIPDLDLGSFRLGKAEQPDLLATVTDGFGAQTKVEYSTLVDADNNGKPLYTPETIKPTFPQMPAGRNLQVVKKLSTSNGQGGYNDRFFNYTGARVDVQGRGFLGFANVQVTDAANSITTLTDYRLGFPFNGRVDTVTSKTVSGKLISSVKNVYAIQDSNPRFPYLSYSIQKSYRLTTTDANLPLSVSKMQNSYDACGNLTEKISDMGTGVSGAIITGVLSHQRIVNQINSYAASDCSDDFIEQTTRETSKTSTTDDFRSVVTTFTPNNTSVNKPKDIAKTTVYKDTAVERSTTITRSASGLVTGTQEDAKDIDSGTMATRSVSTSNFLHGMYPQTVTSSLSSGDMITSTAFDFRFGEAEYVKTPNGLATTRTFDSLGRVVDEYSPDMSRRELVAFYCSAMSAVTCPSNAVYGVATRVTNTFLAGSLGAPLSIIYYDVLQRPVRSTTYTLNGNAINVDRVYRADGKIDKVSEPYNSTGSATAWSTFSDYDELGVPHTETAADGGSRTSTFDRSGNSYHITQTVSVIKSTGTDTQISEHFINPLGQVEKVVDALNTPVNYSYNSLGSLATTQVNNNATTLISINYDAAGNKSNMVDPDAGVIDFEFNGFGELRRQTWQKGTSFAKSITLNYDQLGRQVSRVDQPVSGASTSYSWVWDTQQKGLLSSVSGNGQNISYAYDELGRLSAMNTSITGTTDKLFTYTYDAFSRPATVVYPNGLSIQRVYHAAGMAVQTQDITDPANPKVLWALGNDVDDRGSFTNQLWGNGVVTQTGFNALNGQLKSIKSGHLTATSTINNLAGDIQNLRYVFDSIGNLESRNTQRTNGAGVALENTTEQFTYDKLNRLKTSTTSGLFARFDSYDYDELGNLKRRASYNGSSSTNEDVGALVYAGTNGAGVHAVTSAGGMSYQYDKYGNMILRGSESITYDVFNKPIRISNMVATTSIDYDANHDRFRESDGSSTTYALAGGLYEEIVVGSTVTQKSYVDGVIINTKIFNSGTLASNDTQYVHTDHLGSGEAISDKFGAYVNRMSFSDWGKRQKADWSTGFAALNFPTSNGYTGHHELDKHNLVHMGGRVYDPRLGRFLSADLFVQSPYSSQSYNRYSYVMNNPMGRIDPTGYCARGPSTADIMMYSLGIETYENMHAANVMDTMASINSYETRKAEEKASLNSDIHKAVSQVLSASEEEQYDLNGQFDNGDVDRPIESSIQLALTSLSRAKDALSSDKMSGNTLSNLKSMFGVSPDDLQFKGVVQSLLLNIDNTSAAIKVATFSRATAESLGRVRLLGRALSTDEIQLMLSNYDKTAAAFVYSQDVNRNIFLNDLFYFKNDFRRAMTLVHEGSHFNPDGFSGGLTHPGDVRAEPSPAAVTNPYNFSSFISTYAY